MTVHLERISSGLATITLDRPEKRNALTLEMFQQFGDILVGLDADDDVRCIVVRGSGGSFCAGSDIGSFAQDREGRTKVREYAEFTVRMTDTLKDCRHPTVAQIEGACVGGGLEIAALCDIRIAATNSRFGMPINRIGITVDYRELADLISLVGHSVALELLLEGHIFGAEEALTKKLVTRVVNEKDLEKSVSETVSRIMSGAPLVNRAHKAFVRRLRRSDPLSADELDEAYACFDSDDYRIGRDAFSQKVKPVFTGR